MNNEKVLLAFELIQSGHFQRGLDILVAESMRNPGDWTIHYHIGMAWRMVGDFDKAIMHYNKALEHCPQNLAAGHVIYFGLGIAYQLKRNFDQAIIYLKKAHEMDKTSVPVLNSLGLTYKKKGDIPKALETYNQAIRTLMNNILEELKNSSYQVKEEFIDGERKKVAMLNSDIFDRVRKKLKENDLYCTLLNNIGVCYAESGRVNEARAAFLESIEFIPDGMKYDDPYIGLQELERM